MTPEQMDYYQEGYLDHSLMVQARLTYLINDYKVNSELRQALIRLYEGLRCAATEMRWKEIIAEHPDMTRPKLNLSKDDDHDAIADLFHNRDGYKKSRNTGFQ